MLAGGASGRATPHVDPFILVACSQENTFLAFVQSDFSDVADVS
jgi:hypothetical protein